MNEEELKKIEEAMKVVIKTIFDDATTDTGSVIMSMLRLVIAPIIKNAPDDKWKNERVRMSTPCKRPTCDCHVHGDALWKELDYLRREALRIDGQDKGVN